MSAATTGSSRPRTPRPARRTPGAQWLPRQHGAWAMLLVPAVVGAVRGGFDGLQLVLAVGVLTAYGAVNAAGLAVRARDRRRYLRPVLTYGGLAALCGIVALVAHPALLVWLSAYLPLGLVAGFLTWRRRERSLLNDAVTILAACLVAGVMFQAGPGRDGLDPLGSLAQWQQMAWVVVALFAYFFGTALYVKTVIRERTNPAYHRASVGYHAGWAVFWALSGLVGVPVGAATRVGLVVLFLLLTARAKVMAGRRVKPLYVGLGEIGFSALIAVLTILW
ncbi:MAG: YwiC-like family protein [Actinobacteria bacterium]|nr:YwiC-like family protein [Actinomycetota bacterium]